MRLPFRKDANDAPYLEEDDSEEDAAGNLDLLPHQDHGDTAKLADLKARKGFKNSLIFDNNST